MDNNIIYEMINDNEIFYRNSFKTFNFRSICNIKFLLPIKLFKINFKKKNNYIIILLQKISQFSCSLNGKLAIILEGKFGSAFKFPT